MQWFRSRAAWFNLVSIALALAIHLWWMTDLPRAYRQAIPRDYASYHHAFAASRAGVDPWRPGLVAQHARQSEGRVRVPHPYLYPAPFLLTQFPFQGAVGVGYQRWMVADVGLSVVLGIGVMAAMARTHPLALGVTALVVGCASAPVNHHIMGQANHLVALMMLVAMESTWRKRTMVGGAFLGVAAMLKMSPAVFVAMALVQRRWRFVVGALAAALVLSVASLAIVPMSAQLRFYTDVLPGFGRGDYNGLGVSVHLFGNHSLPNLMDGFWPGERRLSSRALQVARFLSVAGFVLLAIAFRRPPRDRLVHLARWSALTILMVLTPVYTWEHHLVLVLPACAVAIVGSLRREVSVVTLVVTLPAVVCVAWDLQHLKTLAVGPLGTDWWLQEAKPLSLIWIGTVCTAIGATPWLREASKP